MTDVLLKNTVDGGEIEVTNGRFAVDDGLFTAVYLSLFGGNEDDTGSDGDQRKQYWGNWSETDPARQYRSETQAILRRLPLIPANLKRIEDAARNDLVWMVPYPASEIVLAATMPALNTVAISGWLLVDGEKVPFKFEEQGV